MKKLYEENGVKVSKTSLSEGDEVTLHYNGCLVKNGADLIYAHLGYGNEWSKLSDIPMERSKDGFRTTIKIEEADRLNICFRDRWDNWDNNWSQNYSFQVDGKKSKSTISTNKAKAIKAGEVIATAKAAGTKTTKKIVDSQKTTQKTSYK